MILSAFYIPKGSIEHLFGKDHQGFIINLGGKNFYTAEFNSDVLYLELKQKNQEFISDFFAPEISHISAIVGKNGIGKTTLLRVINECIDKKSIKCLYIFEHNEQIYILNEIENQSYLPIYFKPIEIAKKSYSTIFYSSETDLDLRSAMQFVYDIEGNYTLEDLSLKQTTNNLKFLTNPISHKIKKIYDDFPSYDELHISITNHKKDYFKYVYANANLGNQNRVDVLKTYINGDLQRIKDNTLTDSINNILINYLQIINSNGLNHMFDELWNLDEYKKNTTSQTIHQKQDFINNFEITILSYLILNTTFPRTPFQGYYNFNLILEANSFEEKLNCFLELFLTNSDNLLTTSLLDCFGKIELSNYSEISKKVTYYKTNQAHKFTKEQFKEIDAVNLAEMYLNQMNAIYNYYNYLRNIINDNSLKIEKDKLIFDTQIHSIEILNVFVNNYNSLIDSVKNLPLKIKFLDFEPNKVLSTGEKSILKFYANIHNYIQSNLNRSDYKKEQFYLFLLDEPELGYHPLWKKKFINALSTTFPLLLDEFKNVEIENKLIEDSTNNHYIQIIFTTHDPLTLSDIPSKNIVYLDQNKDSTTKIDDGLTNTKKTFGANIHELLADSFFISNGLIGEFAKEKIDKTLHLLNLKITENEKHKVEVKIDELQKKEIKKMIDIIDEPIIKFKLIEMFNLAFPSSNHIDEEIQLLEEKLKELKSRKND